MLCQKCGKNQANVHIQNVINGQKTELHLCSQCAAESGVMSGVLNPFAAVGGLFGDLGSFFSNDFDSLFSGLGGLLPGVMNGENGEAQAGTEEAGSAGFFDPSRISRDDGPCPLCGATPNDIASTGRAGCPQCYSHFRGLFEPIIRRIHGNATHTGSIPASAGEALKRQRRIESLKSELHAAVAAQEYEKAARLRDEIRSLEKEKGQSA